MGDKDESELPSSQASNRVIQSSDTRIIITDEELKYRKNLFPEPESVLKSKIQCTACGTSLMKHVNKGKDLFFHPMLQVLICEDCRAFYGDGSFPLDDDNSDQYCRWCAQGGSLYCCSACNFVFCKSCVRRNFRKSMLEEIEEEDWKCFMCNPEALWKHRAICAAARKYVSENPGDEDEEDIESSNDERRRERRRVAREKSRLKGKNSIENLERTKRSKPTSQAARRARRVDSSDDDDDDSDTGRPSCSKKPDREKSERKKKEKGKSSGKRESVKGKEVSNEDESSSEDDEDKGKKKKKHKERDKGQRQERRKVKERNVPSSTVRSDDDEMVSVGESSKSMNQVGKNEDAEQIAVMRKTCHAIMGLAKEAFTFTFVTNKKTRRLYKWISEKNKVSHDHLPTTPVKCTKMIETFKLILRQLSGNIEELQGKISVAEKDWMRIVEENNASEKELENNKGLNTEEDNVEKGNSQEEGESMSMTNETRLVNGVSNPRENEAEKNRDSKNLHQSDDSSAENIDNLTSGGEEENYADNHEGGDNLENGPASDCDKSLASAVTVRLETNYVDDKNNGKGNKVEASSDEEMESSSKKRSRTILSSEDEDDNGRNAVGNLSESEKVSEEKVSDKTEEIRSDDCTDATAEGSKANSDVEMEDTNPALPDSTKEGVVNSSKEAEEDSTKLVEGEESRFENSVQDLFAADEEGGSFLNKTAESSTERGSDGEGIVKGKHSSVRVGGLERTSACATGEVRENGVENKDNSESDESHVKVKPSTEDKNAKLAFLLDTSVSSSDSDDAPESKGKKLQERMSKVYSSDSESVSENEGDDSSTDKKISRTKKSKSLFSACEVVPQYEDEKLKAGCFVYLERLRNHNYRQVDLIVNSKKVDSITRAINRLGNFANLEKPQTKSESDSDDEVSGKKKKRYPKKKSLTKDSENDSDKDSKKSGPVSDDDDDDISSIMAPSKLNEKSNEKMLDTLTAELLANSSNLESSSSDEESEDKSKKADDSDSKKKNKKKEKKEKEVEIKEEKDTSTDDEEIFSNVKWKRDKLLREKLSATDSSEEEKMWRKKKEKEKAKSHSEDSESEYEAPKTRRKTCKNLTDTDSDVQMLSSDSVKSCDSSDFEVSKKKKKVMKRKNQSDSSSDKSSGSDVKKKKKRRRIKMMDSDSDGDILSVEEKEKKDNKKGKEETAKGKIHRQGMKGRLAQETKAAGKEEEERMKRIAERQKLYNEIFTDMRNLEDLKSLVLDFDPDTKKPLVSVHPTIVKKLKPHQAEGVKFMWEACFESLKQMEETNGSGCILAHCMGLGKTLQVITLVHTLLTNPKTKVHTVLVICPLSTVLNWVNEFELWLKDLGSGEDVEVFELTKYKANVERMYQLKDWKKEGGVMIMGYTMYRNLTGNRKLSKKFSQAFQSTLVDPGPDLVICDEGHLLKNIQSGLSKAVNSIKTSRRIVLTGTPLQNNLKEYHCMIQFVKPSLLGTQKEFQNRFIHPITSGQLAESTPHDVRVMKRRAHVLHKMLEGCVQRQDYSVLTPFLPPKYEYVIAIQLTELQIKLYVHYLENFASKKGGATLFLDYQNLQRIWTHPRLLKIKAENEEKKRLSESESEGSLKDFICDDSTSESSSSEDSNPPAKKRITRSGKKQGKEDSDSDVVCVRGEENKEKESKEEEGDEPKEGPPGGKEWWESFVVPEDFDVIEHGGKLVLLFDILQKCELIGDKVLVFSQSLISLDVIEYFLENIDDITQKMGPQAAEDSQNLENANKFIGSWSKGLDYFRIDGSVSAENRSVWCKAFNRPDNLRARLFLISTRAGGMGINLIGANRVILFDASWNPSNDLQSIFRIYRFGQTKPCYVYRFLAQGTMEEKIYNRQVTKLSLALRVIDEQQIERHFNQHDLQEMYMYDPKQKTSRPTPILPKDRLLAELIQKYPNLIDNYHEHDSLLENKTEEELTEEERKAAWEDFENDKKGVLPAVNQAMMGVVNYAGSISQSMYGANLFPETAQALREAILEMHPNATEEQRANELRLAASRISQYFHNPSYPQMLNYYDSAAKKMLTGPTNMYASQAQGYAQQAPLLQNQYGLQNYYHNPVLPSTSFTNHNRMTHPIAGNITYNAAPSVSNQPIQPVNLEANVPPQNTALTAPLIKIRRDLMDPSVAAASDNDIVVEAVRRREV
ncbi:transcriptional regulator ATRX homolog isoform X2 [Ischnura elegans]|uniref:transcriptional regulator ATRX homolog isoform X2 n=1 Tax=Ischnura elegans TaxID=197161 RepID=UPI001ED88E98|nr:transcriptional regulator ATRX homolog isoform X2 [Ischnura elegans]